MTDYQALNAQLKALTEGIPYKIANLANASALLWEHLQDINWAGFYMMEDGALVLGPFQGKTACIRIPVGRVCAARLWRKMPHSWFRMCTCFPDTLPAIAHPILRS